MRKHFIIKDLPLVGVNAFGLIDRGTNIIQVRPISGCPLNCIYCSVDEGLSSRKINTYEVETNHLVSEFNKITAYKGSDNIEAHIDGLGEPLLYKNITLLIKKIRENKSVKTISMQTNGVLLNKILIKDLKVAGIDRINLSINSTDYELAKRLSGTDNYNVKNIVKTAENITQAGINLLLAPVLIPGYNEESMHDLIKLAKDLNAVIGIQKFEHHKHGRRLKVKEQSWYAFNKLMKVFEKTHNTKLLLSRKDFNIEKTRSLPIIFKKGEKVKGSVVLPGWLSNEVIIRVNNRLVAVFNSEDKIKDLISARIVKTKHNLYLAEKIRAGQQCF